MCLLPHRAGWWSGQRGRRFAGASVGHAVEHAVGVVRHQQRTIPGHRQPHRAGDMGFAAIGQEAGDEWLDRGRLSVGKTYAHNLVARGRAAVPRPAHGNERVALVLGRETGAPVKQHLHRRRVGGVAQHHRRAMRFPVFLADVALRCALRIDAAGAVDVRPAILFAQFELVDFLGLLVVAQEVNAVVHAPQLASARVPVETDGVAQAAGEDAALLAVGRRAQQGGIFRIAFVAGIAGRAGADVQHAVGTKSQRAVGMLTGVRQVADEQL